jgi:hypothetical protein
MGREDNGLSLEGLTQRLETLERQNAKLRRKVATLGVSGTRRRTGEEADPRSRRRTGEHGAAAVGLATGGAPTTATMGVCVANGSSDIHKRYIAAKAYALGWNGSDRDRGVRLPGVFVLNTRARRNRW